MRITDHQELQVLLSSMRREQHELMDHIHSIMWNMRGSISREEAWVMSNEERKGILKQIDERMKMVEKSGLALI